MSNRGKVQPWLEEALAQDTDECILWPFSVGSHGYGDFMMGRERHLAHRYICTAAHGEPPAHMDAAHYCGVKLCCNRRHLRWATRAENHADKKIHGRQPTGEKLGFSKLSPEKVREIRRAGESAASLASRFGVHRGTIYAVRHGRSWRHVQ